MQYCFGLIGCVVVLLSLCFCSVSNANDHFRCACEVFPRASRSQKNLGLKSVNAS